MAMAARPSTPGLQDVAAYAPSADDLTASGVNHRGFTPRSTMGSRPNSFAASGSGALLDAQSYPYPSSSPYAGGAVVGVGATSAATPGSYTHAPVISGAAAESSSYHANHAPLHQHPPRFYEDFDAASQRGSVVLDGPSATTAAAAAAGKPPTNTSTSAATTPTPGAAIQRSVSQMSSSHSRSATPTRSSTLKKRASLTKRGSMRRSGSRKSMRAGSVRSLNLGDREKYGAEGADDVNSAFAVPIPTDGNPTDVLANRFQAWRKILKDLIVFFKELQKSYEMRSKLYLSASNVINNSAMPPSFLKSGGLADATEVLRDFHRQGYLEANKAAEVENEVVNQLMGLRNDLQKKTKEIKGLSGDFKNTVDKEVEGTRKAVRHLHEALGLVDTDPSATSGRGDPFIVRLTVDRQIEKQIEEENYLHRAYHNLENSGRELESIVVGEIQKAYNAYANILKREADEAYDTAEKLHAGPISMPQDHEWNSFIADADDMIDPHIPLRSVENITYPGKDHPAAAEVRSGMLERKSKYLKSYTPGWYVLSPTHLHEFKSADRVSLQTPVMSLYLPDQKLGSHSEADSSSESHKFMLKGRKTGTMQRGHSWVFRAESHDTMMSWYEDIDNLMSKTGEARNAFVRRHTRTLSGHSFQPSPRCSMLEDEDDEADRTPYAGHVALMNGNPEQQQQQLQQQQQQQPPPSELRQAGGRFPSDLQIDRHLQVPLSPSSGESSGDRDLLAVVGSSGPDRTSTPLAEDGHPFMERSVSSAGQTKPGSSSNNNNNNNNNHNNRTSQIERHSSYYGNWMAGARQQQANQHQVDNTNTNINERRNTFASSDTNIPASTGFILAHDSSMGGGGPRRTRRESASTAPTSTVITDYTNNTGPTMPSSVDDTQATSIAEFGGQESTFGPVAVPVPVQEPGKPDSSSINRLSRNLSRSGSVGTGAGAEAGDGAGTGVGIGEELRPAPTSASTGTGRTKGSVSTLELKIPGHYPPANVAV